MNWLKNNEALYEARTYEADLEAWMEGKEMFNEATKPIESPPPPPPESADGPILDSSDNKPK